MLSSVSAATTLRFNEVRTFLTEIKQQEVAPPGRDSDFVMLLRGLFYVHLYGAFEYSINNAARSYLRAVSGAQVQYLHLEQMFYAVALDNKFASIASRSAGKKWNLRHEFLSRQCSTEICGLNDTLFGAELQNIWYKTLLELFQILGVPGPVIPDPRFKLYIDEVVEKRNAVAHGRETPVVLGAVRSPELELRYDALSATAMHVVGLLDAHLVARAFVNPAHRAVYAAP